MSLTSGTVCKAFKDAPASTVKVKVMIFMKHTGGHVLWMISLLFFIRLFFVLLNVHIKLKEGKRNVRMLKVIKRWGYLFFSW